MKLKIRVVLVVLVAVTTLSAYKLLSQNATSSQSSISSEVRFVAAGIENAYHQLQCAQASVTRYQLIPKDAADYIDSRIDALSNKGKKAGVASASKDEEQRETAKWFYQTPKLHMIVEPDPNQGNPNVFMFSHRLLADNKVATTVQGYQHTGTGDKTRGRLYYKALINPASETLKNGLWSFYRHMDPRFYAYFAAAGEPLEQFLNSPAASFKGQEVIEDSQCMKVEVTRAQDWREIYWIDTKHSFVVRRSEHHARYKDKWTLVRQTQVPRLIESQGSWLPGVVEKREYIGPKRTEVLERVTISDFKANCQFPPETFNLSWPLGTNITDNINQKDLVVIAVEQKDLTSLSRLKKEREKQEEAGKNAQPKEEGKP